MNLLFTNPGFDYNIESIMLFQSADANNWWSGVLFDVFPQLNRVEFDALEQSQKQNYLQDRLYGIYKSEEKTLDEKVMSYNEYWTLHKAETENVLSDVFGINCHKEYNDIKGKVTLNPVCPRFLATRAFDVYYKYSERGALAVSTHEIIHFLWFDVWQRHFKDDTSEYETPHMKWVLSEAVIDTIIRNDKRLCGQYPHTVYAYEDFYGIRIDGTPILDTLNLFYRNSSIIEFMQRGYDFFIKHEAEIRAQGKNIFCTL